LTKCHVCSMLEYAARLSCMSLALVLCLSPLYNPDPTSNHTVSFVMHKSVPYRLMLTFCVLCMVVFNYWYLSRGLDYAQDIIIKTFSVALVLSWALVIFTEWGPSHYYASVAFTGLAFAAFAFKLHSTHKRASGSIEVMLLVLSYMCMALALQGALYLIIKSDYSHTAKYAIMEHSMLFHFALGTTCMQC